MATAFKHLYTRATCSIASGGSIESVTYRVDTIEGDWQQAEGGWTGGVIIRRRDKSIVRFDQAIEAVIEMWRTFIYAEAPALDLTADGPPANSPGLSGEIS
ncbi:MULTISPECIES: hypothetical protein [unclassified Mesorhizobium]|uniref:hypothetical protein n=1 Tax=unclassified Mesorhizobium TaxID=325217 RepID=UPI00333E14EB